MELLFLDKAVEWAKINQNAIKLPNNPNRTLQIVFILKDLFQQRFCSKFTVFPNKSLN